MLVVAVQGHGSLRCIERNRARARGACRSCRGLASPGASCTLPPSTRSLLAGVRAASPEAAYLLCLDDDVLLHPGLLAALVRDMEADPSLFMATGAWMHECVFNCAIAQ